MAASRAPGADAQREIQEAILLGENLQAEFRALEEQRAYLDALLRDMRRGRDAVEALKEAKQGQEVLLPVGGGALVRATLADEARVLATLGSGIVVETSAAHALARLEERIQTGEANLQRLGEELARIEQNLGQLNAHLERLSGG